MRGGVGMIEISVEALFGLCIIAPLFCLTLGYLLRDFEGWCSGERD